MRVWVVNLVVAALTAIAVLVTLVSAFKFPPGPPIRVNTFFAVVIILMCASHLFLICWNICHSATKFSAMVYFNAFTMILLCVCGNLYIHAVGTSSGSQQNTTTPNQNQSSTVG